MAAVELRPRIGDNRCEVVTTEVPMKSMPWKSFLVLIFALIPFALSAQEKNSQSYDDFYAGVAKRCHNQGEMIGLNGCDNWIPSCLTPVFECLRKGGCTVSAGANPELACPAPALDCVPQDFTAQAVKFKESTKCQSLAVDPEKPGCGNQVVEVHEQCDDGNEAEGDGCAANCGVQFAPAPKGCGNGQLDAGEECDAGADNGKVSAGCDLECRKFPAGNAAPENKDVVPGQGAAQAGGCALQK